MIKIEKMFYAQKNELRENLYRYTVTIILGIIASILAVIFDFADKMDSKAFQHIETIITLTIVGCFFSETYFVRNEKREWKILAPLCFLSLFISVIADIVLSCHDNFSEKTVYWQYVYITVFYAVIFLLTIYRLVIINELPIEKYFARVIFGLLKIGILFLILNLAALLILEIFNTLIINIEYWSTVSRIELLLCGFLYFPYSIRIISCTREDNSKFTKNLVMYALMPSVLIATIIIYMYIFKAVFLMKLPDNQVFSICAWLFIIGMPVWLMADVFLQEKTNGVYKKIVEMMPYIYSPFVVLEIICLAIRIKEYGITDKRYLGVIFIIFQIIYILWKPPAAKKTGKKEYRGLTFVIIILTVITLLIPGINIMNVSYLSQKHRYENAVKEQDYEEAAGPYYYLKYCIYGKEYLNEKYTKNERKEIEKKMSIINSYDYDREVYVSFSCSKGMENGINISGYSSIYSFNYSVSDITKNDLSAISINYNDEDYLTADLEDIFTFLYENEMNTYEDKTYEIDVNNESRLVITGFKCSCDEYGDKISSLKVNGYILTK